MEVRLDQAQRDFSHMDERIKFLRAEKSEQFEMVDDLQMELGKAFVKKYYFNCLTMWIDKTFFAFKLKIILTE